MTVEPTTTTEPNVCYRHPETETGLRCNKCNRYICAKCATRTPVGYTCPACIRKQEDKFYNGIPVDYLIAAAIALPLSLVISYPFIFLVQSLGWFSWIITFFASPFVAGFIAEAVRWGVKRRRSRYLSHVATGSFLLAVLPYLLYLLAVTFFAGGAGLMGMIVPGIYLFLGTGTIMARLR